jgi:hypothetical protein
MPRASGLAQQLTSKILAALVETDRLQITRKKLAKLERSLRKEVLRTMENGGRVLVNEAPRRIEASRLVEFYLSLRGDARPAPYQLILAGREYVDLREAASRVLLAWAESLPETIVPAAPPPPGLAPLPGRPQRDDDELPNR